MNRNNTTAWAWVPQCGLGFPLFILLQRKYLLGACLPKCLTVNLVFFIQYADHVEQQSQKAI